MSRSWKCDPWRLRNQEANMKNFRFIISKILIFIPFLWYCGSCLLILECLRQTAQRFHLHTLCSIVCISISEQWGGPIPKVGDLGGWERHKPFPSVLWSLSWLRKSSTVQMRVCLLAIFTSRKSVSIKFMEEEYSENKSLFLKLFIHYVFIFILKIWD